MPGGSISLSLAIQTTGFFRSSFQVADRLHDEGIVFSTFDGVAVMSPPTSELMIQVIGKIPLFKGYSPTQVRLALGMCEHRVLEAEEILFKAGAPPEEMFILVAGELARLTADGMVVEEILPVTSVGEVQLMTGQAHSATLQVTKSSHVFAISRFRLERMLRGDLDVQIKTYKNLTITLLSQMNGENMNAQLSTHREEKQQYEARIAMLERHLKQQGQKLNVALELLTERAEVTREEAEFYLSDQLKNLVPRVLIVDDEPEFRHFVKKALAAFMVVEAKSGREALEIVQEERLDLIITDIKMSEMDGVALLTNLRSKFPGLPVLAVSGYLGAEEMQNYGFDGFIDKPIGSQQLQEMVEVTLTRSN